MNNCNCNCNCNKKYILMRPLHLDNNVTIPEGTIIHGPINPYWFADDIVKVYNGPGESLNINDIIMTDYDFDIKIEDDKTSVKKKVPKGKCNCKCKCKEKCKCHCNPCKCLPSDKNVIIFDVGEPSRVTLEEMSLFETLREVKDGEDRNKVIKKRSYP